MNISFEMALALLAQFIGLCFFIWRVSTWFAVLDTRIEKNQRDINNAANSIREDARENYQVIQMQISHVQEHLAVRDGYHAPTIRKWDNS